MHFKLAWQEESCDVSGQIILQYVVLPDCESCKTKLDNTEMAQTFFFFI